MDALQKLSGETTMNEVVIQTIQGLATDMRHAGNFSLCAVLLVFNGCVSTPEIHSRGDSTDQLAAYRTFAVLPIATSDQLAPETGQALAKAAAAGARDALHARGYTETTRDNADLVFYLHGKSLAAVPVTDWNYVPNPSQFGTGPAEMKAATNRIFVETYDNHSKRQVWMGWLDCSCKKIDPERIQHEIARILETFPSRMQAVTSLQSN